ncbi:hypothetical protein P3T25_009752 [Paraburkholderia sp. GAS32]
MDLEPASMRAFFRLFDSACYIVAALRDGDSARGFLSGRPQILAYRRRIVVNESVLLGTLFG